MFKQMVGSVFMHNQFHHLMSLKSGFNEYTKHLLIRINVDQAVCRTPFN